MRMRIHLSLILVIVVIAAPRAARACSGLQCASLEMVVPADGATDVPTNTELHVVYGSWCLGPRCSEAWSGEHVRLRVAGGEEVPLASTSREGRLRPVDELIASTTYEILDLAWASELSCEGELPLVVVSSFTTGAGPDHTPPATPEVTSVGACAAESCDSTSCCGPYEASWVTVRWATSTDDSAAPIGYAVVGRDDSTFYDVSSARLVSDYPCVLGEDCVDASSGRYQLVAIDVAGNTSPPSDPFDVDLSCVPEPDPAGTPDAGVPRSDAGDAPPIDAPRGACGCTAGGAPGSAGALLVLSLALVGLRRRSVGGAPRREASRATSP